VATLNVLANRSRKLSELHSKAGKKIIKHKKNGDVDKRGRNASKINSLRLEKLWINLILSSGDQAGETKKQPRKSGNILYS